MKHLIAALVLSSSIATAAAAGPASITVSKPFETTAHMISKQIEHCYVESGILVGGFHVWDDIDYDAKTGKCFTRSAALRGRRPP